MRRYSHSKIVATLGPASSSPEMIEKLFLAGADIFRLNASHGTHDEHRARYEAIRLLEVKYGRPVAILLDLQGPKLRLATFQNGKESFSVGDKLRLELDTTPGDKRRVGMPHPEIFAALEPNTALLLDDGKMRLRVDECGPGFAETTVMLNGELSNRKGVNVPDVVLPLSALTDKDRTDLHFGLDVGVDWIALSFVQRPQDVAEARRLIAGRAMVLSKLEKPAAIHCLEELVDMSDAIMVARGDLGVEMPPEQVPCLQKRIVKACRRAGKPVVVATQMLDSMVKAPAPTRAEASDVATAIYDGADAVMLSAESAAGDYPVESVMMMERIIRQVEQDMFYRPILETTQPESEATSADAISAAAAQVAAQIRAKAIVTYTASGSTALRVAQKRPTVPILSLTPNPATARRLVLAWGVHSVMGDDAHDFEDMVNKAGRYAQSEGLAQSGDSLVVTAGHPFGMPGATNVLRVMRVG